MAAYHVPSQDGGAARRNLDVSGNAHAAWALKAAEEQTRQLLDERRRLDAQWYKGYRAGRDASGFDAFRTLIAGALGGAVGTLVIGFTIWAAIHP